MADSEPTQKHIHYIRRMDGEVRPGLTKAEVSHYAISASPMFAFESSGSRERPCVGS